MLIRHISGVETVYRNLATDNTEIEQFRLTATFYFNIYFSTFRTSQTLHDFTGTHLYSGNDRIVYSNNAVSCHQSHFFRRAAGNHLDNINRIGKHIELDTDTVEIADQGSRHLLGFFRVGIGGMRVQFVKHSDNGIFYQFRFIRLIDVQIFDGVKSQLKFSCVFMRGILLLSKRREKKRNENEENQKAFHRMLIFLFTD